MGSRRNFESRVGSLCRWEARYSDDYNDEDVVEGILIGMDYNTSIPKITCKKRAWKRDVWSPQWTV